MNVMGIILIGIGILGIFYSVGLLSYRAGIRSAENRLIPQNKKETVLWSKLLKLPGFRVIIYRIKSTDG